MERLGPWTVPKPAPRAVSEHDAGRGPGWARSGNGGRSRNGATRPRIRCQFNPGASDSWPTRRRRSLKGGRKLPCAKTPAGPHCGVKILETLPESEQDPECTAHK
ncbi:hypothetical protein GCM10023081_34120 [Arthrobacter ginkgonis]|uniref:Uncharacterized protein n=1 Tax=Arthrobacter ginkgonis TaxID=1630594 RepID=A0ABP7CTF7_9MICC